jgi:hypothetical protein
MCTFVFIAALLTVAMLWNQPRYPSMNKWIKEMWFVCIYNNEVLFSNKEEQNHVLCRKMDGTGDDHVKRNKPDSERQISHFISCVE